MKKVQFEIGNGKVSINVSSAPCEVTLVKVAAISDEAVRVTVEIPSRQREDFMDWLVNNRFQFVMTGMSFQDEFGITRHVGQADAEEAFGWMRSTDLDLIDREHHSDALIRQSFIDQVD
jgi:hypothetical protein